jgi:hypothetical protein
LPSPGRSRNGVAGCAVVPSLYEAERGGFSSELHATSALVMKPTVRQTK